MNLTELGALILVALVVIGLLLYDIMKILGRIEASMKKKD
jgi:hypothetical protein